MTSGNLFAELPGALHEELVTVLAEGPGVRVERIVSTGQITPPGEWYDSDHEEWVVLLAGAARLRFEGQPAARALAPGDWVRISAHARHRVEWTDPARATVWLAVHFETPHPDPLP